MNFNYKKIAKVSIFFVIFVYILIYADITLRAKHCYLQGEKYYKWHQNPVLKKEQFLKEYSKKTGMLEKKFLKGKISKEELDVTLDKLNMERDFKIKESSIKYAYMWYKTALDSFSRPHSKWVRLCEEKMNIAKKLWKEELKANKIYFEEYMLE
jgi:hypothetical protein